jgi:hypothetical protein
MVEAAGLIPAMSPWAQWTLLIVAVSGVAGAFIALRRPSTSILVILLAALAIRVVVAVLSRGHTPADIGVATHNITEQIHRRRDPLTVLPRYRWNFLPFMPTLYALLEHLGLPWQYTVKLPAIGADLVCVWLVGILRPERRRSVQWLYATNPVCVLVSAVHGQVEPTALAFGLGALVIVRRSPLTSGMLLGLAVSAKTWPVIFFPGLLRAIRARSWPYLIAGAVVGPALFVIEGIWLLHDHLHAVVHRLVGYRSFIGTWGWTGILRYYGKARVGYAGHHIDEFQRIGTVLLLVVTVAVLLVFRRRSGADMVLALMLAFYATTAGFGVQYLMWSVPLALTQLRRAAAPFLALASAYSAAIYLYAIPVVASHPRKSEIVTVWGSIPVILAALVALAALIKAGWPHSTRRSDPPAPSGAALSTQSG